MLKRRLTGRNFRKALAHTRRSRLNPTQIRLLVLDFDGVMTDNKVYLDESGREMVCCFRADGLGIEELKRSGVKVLVISKERNRVVKARCQKLGVKSIQGIDDKLKTLREVLRGLNIPPSQVCYLGNDINDIECVKLAGLGCAVRDSHPGLLKEADYVTEKKGGRGAVREICDLILGRTA